MSLYVDGALDASQEAWGTINVNDTAVQIGANTEHAGPLLERPDRRPSHLQLRIARGPSEGAGNQATDQTYPPQRCLDAEAGDPRRPPASFYTKPCQRRAGPIEIEQAGTRRLRLVRYNRLRASVTDADDESRDDLAMESTTWARVSRGQMRSLTKAMRGINPGYGQFRWVVLLLAVAVVLPTLCLLWFMSEVVKNERLAVRQRLTSIYKASLAETTAEVEQKWAERCQRAGVVAPARIRTTSSSRPRGSPAAPGCLVYDERRPTSVSGPLRRRRGRWRARSRASPTPWRWRSGSSTSRRSNATSSTPGSATTRIVWPPGSARAARWPGSAGSTRPSSNASGPPPAPWPRRAIPAVWP